MQQNADWLRYKKRVVLQSIYALGIMSIGPFLVSAEQRVYPLHIMSAL